jgi:hypothetical protein
MSYRDMEKLGLLLWSEVTVDMIGPWTIEVGNRTEKFSALTIIDLVTNLIACVTNKTSAAVTAHFVNVWLTCYPKPMSCIHDPGLEFIGWHSKKCYIVTTSNLVILQQRIHKQMQFASKCTNQLVIA